MFKKKLICTICFVHRVVVLRRQTVARLLRVLASALDERNMAMDHRWNDYIDRGRSQCLEKLCPLPLSVPQSPLGLALDRTTASDVRDRRLYKSIAFFFF